MAYRADVDDWEYDDPDDDDDDGEFDLNIPVIPRKPFIKEFAANYYAGQHATFLGPSGRGKTQLAGELAGASVRRQPEIQIRALHGKIRGRDKTIEKFAKAADLTMSAYPEPTWLQRRVTRRKSHGHIVRPLSILGLALGKRMHSLPDGTGQRSTVLIMHLPNIRSFSWLMKHTKHTTISNSDSIAKHPSCAGGPSAESGLWSSADVTFRTWFTIRLNTCSSSLILTVTTSDVTLRSAEPTPTS